MNEMENNNEARAIDDNITIQYVYRIAVATFEIYGILLLLVIASIIHADARTPSVSAKCNFAMEKDESQKIEDKTKRKEKKMNKVKRAAQVVFDTHRNNEHFRSVSKWAHSYI